MGFFTIPILLAIIIGCCIRRRNLRKLRRLNAFLNDAKNTGSRPSSVLEDWMNRRKGFKKLDQYSDEEHEPLDNSLNDDLNTNEIDQEQTRSSMTNNVAFKMGANL